MQIKESQEMAGIKVGLFIDDTIYVSREIKCLCDSDPELMKGNLRVIKMPIENGKNKFNSLSSWIAYLIENDRDIFSKNAMNGHL